MVKCLLQKETRGPALFFKDNCNSKSNYQNVGTILSSSYNGDMMVYTSDNEVSTYFNFFKSYEATVMINIGRFLDRFDLNC